MQETQKFEEFLLARGQQNFHVLRRGEVLFSLPAAPEAALRALALYQPQRWLARIAIRVLRWLTERSLHTKVLRSGLPCSGAASENWDFLCRPDTVGILRGSKQHVIPRAVASYLGSEGWEVAKLGLGPDARRMLEEEAAVLTALHGRGVATPRCLGLHKQGNMTVLRMPRVGGVPHQIQDQGEVLEMLASWAEVAPAKGFKEFDEWNSIRSALETSAEGRAALDTLSRRVLKPSIRHGDLTSWNLLKQPDGTLVVLDWEWGHAEGMPGLDLAHYFAQELRLVRRLSSGEILRNIEEKLENPAVRNLLRRAGWEGSLLEPVLVAMAYKQGGRHQDASELLEACLKRYMECLKSKSLEPGPAAFASLPAEAVAKAGEVERKCRISVVTPSFRQLGFLKCCAASVRDQMGDIEVEHLIHDGGSGPEFEEWARTQAGADCISERDDGMYDAINRGFRKAKGDIIAWLNCDEQYLPGTLQEVARYFEAHPDVDILFGDIVLVDEVMNPLAYRRAVIPTSGHIRYSHLSTFSAATFVRRRVLDDGHFLQTRWKTIADAVWIDELLLAGYKPATLSRPLAVFSMLGSNLGQSALLFEERAIWEQETGSSSRWVKQGHIWAYRLQRLWRGAYLPRAIRISAYIPGNRRRTHHERWVLGRWKIARELAAEQRLMRDGALGRVLVRLRSVTGTALHVVATVLLSVYLDHLRMGDAIKGPSVLLLSLLFLSFRAKVSHQIAVGTAYFFVAWYLLSERPVDTQFVRLLSFVLGALLSVFWTSSLRMLEAWIRSTMMMVRRLNEPIILADKDGQIVLVNHAASTLLGKNEVMLMGRKLMPLVKMEDGTLQSLPELFAAKGEVPADLVEMSMEGSGGEAFSEGRLFAVGKSRFRMYGFSLERAIG